MKKTILAILILAGAAMADGSRPVDGKGTASDGDQSRARSEAMDQAKDNIQNACPSGRLIPAPQVTKNECRASGPGMVTCTVEISGTCED